MAGTGGRAGPAGCWVAWTTTALSRSGTCGGATASQSARISFELPDNAREPVLGLAGTRVSVTGRNVLLQTQDLQRTLTALLGWANSRGLVLAALDARPASLAEAFHAVAACGGGPVTVTGDAQEVAA
jgi:ABC-2 type transport system ATP-binding protein